MNSENIKSKPVLVKFTLAFSDLFFFNFSLFLSVAVISVISNDIYEYIPKSVMGTFFLFSFCLVISLRILVFGQIASLFIQEALLV